MSESTVPENFENIENPAEELGDAKGMRAELSKMAAEKATIEAQLTATQHETALSKAGLELNDVQRKALEAVHTGEWTPEAVKAAADELGFVVEKTEPPVVDQQEAESLAKVASLGAGAGRINVNQELDAKLTSYATLGRSTMTDGDFMNTVKNDLGEGFFDEHQRNLLNK